MDNKKRSCYKCEKRYPGCHATCKEFEKDDIELKLRKEKERAYQIVEGYIDKAKHDSRDERANKRLRNERYVRKLHKGN